MKDLPENIELVFLNNFKEDFDYEIWVVRCKISLHLNEVTFIFKPCWFKFVGEVLELLKFVDGKNINIGEIIFYNDTITSDSMALKDYNFEGLNESFLIPNQIDWHDNLYLKISLDSKEDKDFFFLNKIIIVNL